MNEEKEDRAKDQARLQLESITRMVTRLRHAQECEEKEDCKETCEDHDGDEGIECYHDEDKARESILEDALEVQVRGSWHTIGNDNPDTDFMILLCTGGPAVCIRGELNEYKEPSRAWLEYQNWFTPWNRYHDGNDETEEYLMEYAQQFYFGE